nr:hypothetical protein Iba_chr10eCG7660 [Ipomoea batatas]
MSRWRMAWPENGVIASRTMDFGDVIIGQKINNNWPRTRESQSKSTAGRLGLIAVAVAKQGWSSGRRCCRGDSGETRGSAASQCYLILKHWKGIRDLGVLILLAILPTASYAMLSKWKLAWSKWDFDDM